MDGGATRKRLQNPPIEYPIIWVDMTSSHWSVWGQEAVKKNPKGKRVEEPKLTDKVRMLIVEDLLDGNNVGLKR